MIIDVCMLIAARVCVDISVEYHIVTKIHSQQVEAQGTNIQRDCILLDHDDPTDFIRLYFDINTK